MRSFVTISVLLLASFYLAESAGLCSNAADMAVFTKFNTTSPNGSWTVFHDDLLNCSEQCIGAGDCAATCLEKATGLSAGCGTCFSADVTCTGTNCMSQCMLDPNSADCLNCNQLNCTPKLAVCAGVPEDVLPK